MESYFDKVYSIVSQIPPGKVATYGQIASILGSSRNARVVGWAMKAAPENLHLPCHRVVNKTGILSPSYVFGDTIVQRTMLQEEGVTFKSNGRIDLENHLWDGI